MKFFSGFMLMRIILIARKLRTLTGRGKVFGISQTQSQTKSEIERETWRHQRNIFSAIFGCSPSWWVLFAAATLPWAPVLFLSRFHSLFPLPVLSLSFVTNVIQFHTFIRFTNFFSSCKSENIYFYFKIWLDSYDIRHVRFKSTFDSYFRISKLLYCIYWNQWSLFDVSIQIFRTFNATKDAQKIFVRYSTFGVILSRFAIFSIYRPNISIFTAYDLVIS